VAGNSGDYEHSAVCAKCSAVIVCAHRNRTLWCRATETEARRRKRGRKTKKARHGKKEEGDLRRRNYKFRCSGDGNEPRWMSRTPRWSIKSDYAAAQPNREHRRFAIIRRNFISFSSAPEKCMLRGARHRYFLFARSGFGLSTTINEDDGIKRASLETIFETNNHGFAQRRVFACE